MSRLRKTVAATLALLLSVGSGGAYAADPPPSDFVSLKFEGECDDKNNRLWLHNTHTFKTIVVTLRWRAAGGKDLTDQLYPGPNSVREIGCAADAEILESKFAEF